MIIGRQIGEPVNPASDLADIELNDKVREMKLLRIFSELLDFLKTSLYPSKTT